MPEIWVATPVGMPAAVSCPYSAPGRLAESPATTSVKMSVRLRLEATFWNVARMPDDAPRCSGGTAFMIEAVLGEAKAPMPIPSIRRSSAKGT